MRDVRDVRDFLRRAEFCKACEMYAKHAKFFEACRIFQGVRNVIKACEIFRGVQNFSRRAKFFDPCRIIQDVQNLLNLIGVRNLPVRPGGCRHLTDGSANVKGSVNPQRVRTKMNLIKICFLIGGKF